MSHSPISVAMNSATPTWAWGTRRSSNPC